MKDRKRRSQGSQQVRSGKMLTRVGDTTKRKRSEKVKKKNEGKEVRKRNFILVNGKLVEFTEAGLTQVYVDDRKEVAGEAPLPCPMLQNGNFRMISWMSTSNGYIGST